MHYVATLRILRYIKGTLFHGLQLFAQCFLHLLAFFDGDWAGDPTNQCSITGYCFFLGHSFISWCNKKQTMVYMVTCASIKVENHALVDTTTELL